MKHRKLKNIELGRKSEEEAQAATKTPLIIVLDNIRSLNNIGSVFRTSDAFLLQKIYLCGITAQPLTRTFKRRHSEQLNLLHGRMSKTHLI